MIDTPRAQAQGADGWSPQTAHALPMSSFETASVEISPTSSHYGSLSTHSSDFDASQSRTIVNTGGLQPKVCHETGPLLQELQKTALVNSLTRYRLADQGNIGVSPISIYDNHNAKCPGDVPWPRHPKRPTLDSVSLSERTPIVVSSTSRASSFPQCTKDRVKGSVLTLLPTGAQQEIERATLNAGKSNFSLLREPYRHDSSRHAVHPAQFSPSGDDKTRRSWTWNGVATFKNHPQPLRIDIMARTKTLPVGGGGHAERSFSAPQVSACSVITNSYKPQPLPGALRRAWTSQPRRGMNMLEEIAESFAVHRKSETHPVANRRKTSQKSFIPEVRSLEFFPRLLSRSPTLECQDGPSSEPNESLRKSSDSRNSRATFSDILGHVARVFTSLSGENMNITARDNHNGVPEPHPRENKTVGTSIGASAHVRRSPSPSLSSAKRDSVIEGFIPDLDYLLTSDTRRSSSFFALHGSPNEDKLLRRISKNADYPKGPSIQFISKTQVDTGQPIYLVPPTPLPLRRSIQAMRTLQLGFSVDEAVVPVLMSPDHSISTKELPKKVSLA